ncbi:FecR family protein [Daejeonella sp. H1SJ63]|uniref:FecR family protein n=1 Tax=Daejeonella sp. H1SJ63 TaxID=3034145 RepID=UPI0023EB1741|nr:FecR family protein [Daejeonella sp. H1SJ63]
MESLRSEERYQELAAKWLNNTISSSEAEEFAQWYNSAQTDEISLPDDYAANEDALKSRIFDVINEHISPVEMVSGNNFRKWYAAAAVITVLLAAGLYFYSDKPNVQNLVSEPVKVESFKSEKSLIITKKSEKNVDLITQRDIEPGEDKAILILGDGTKIILDDAQNGILANQGGNSVLKAAEGELIYSFTEELVAKSADKSAEQIIYNTIETPKGGKFQVRLPDGSKVWLNAASSLRFPTNFAASKRQVELKGEAYFEVAHDESKLFEVNTRNQIVQVLGTHFNINAYADEPSVNTTLLEGSVRVSDVRTNISQLLKPGEQSQLTERIEVVNVKNTAEAVAWKEGYFQFNEADIETVMRQIERWYDVTVRYEGEIPLYRFGGEIERSLSLLQVLKILEKTKVHFRLEGREVIVMP